MNKKADNLGIFCDTALDRYMNRFGLNTSVLGVMNIIFAAFIVGLSFLGFGVIQPALPSFTDGNQLVDGIYFFVIFMAVAAFFIAFFSMASSAGVIAANAAPEGTGLAKTLRAILRRTLGILSLTIAQSFAYLLFFAVLIAIAVINFTSILTLLPYLLAISLLIIILLRTFTFFSVNLVVLEKKYFFSAIFASAKLVFKRGFTRIFIISTFITIIQVVAFFGIFLLLHHIFSPWALIHQMNLVDPLFYVLLGISYIIMSFFAPRLNLVALSFHYPTKHSSKTAGLGSRTLAIFLDLTIPIAVSLLIYLIFAIITGQTFGADYVNFGVIIIFATAFFVVFCAYNIYFEVFENGQTLGKRLMSLRVVNENDEPITLLKSTLRNLLRIVDVVSFILILINKKHHRLGDVLSVTKVIRVDDNKNEDDTDV
ncbi:MAG: RDD family protein [Defluviitaleaceae bacterium]|nr:RDD family protein [Defluviitaleaceae bacterium]